MPDLTATRPAAAAPIATNWGQQVHDMLEGIQAGFVDVSLAAASSGTAAVTFARAYTAAPIVVLTGNSAGTAGLVAKLSSGTPPSTTGFTAAVQHVAGTSTTATVRVYWMAIGNPA